MSAIQAMTGTSIRYLKPVKRSRATGLVAATYDLIESDFALVPPLTIQSDCPEILAGLWITFREVFVVDPAHRTEREIISAGVSQINECPYCVDVHSAMIDASGDHGLASAIRNNGREADEIPLVQWAKSTLSPGAALLANPPFPRALAPQMLGTAFLFHYVNRMVSVHLDDTPAPVHFSSKMGRNLFGRVFGGLLGKRLIAVCAEPGESLKLLENAQPGEAFAWAKPAPIIASALARFDTAVQRTGDQHISAEVRHAVATFLDGWRGEAMPLTNQWIDQACSGLTDEADLTAAKLALLTAVAPYRVDGKLVETFRSHFPGDSALVATTAWASLAAAKRIASWMAP